MPFIKSYDPYSGVELTAAETLAVGDVCVMNTNSTGSRAAKADADGTGLRRPLGVAGQDVVAGQRVTLWSRCIVGGYSGITPGAQYYLSTTPGSISTSLPADGSQVCAVGIGMTPTEVFFDFSLNALAKQSAGTSTATLG